MAGHETLDASLFCRNGQWDLVMKHPVVHTGHHDIDASQDVDKIFTGTKEISRGHLDPTALERLDNWLSKRGFPGQNRDVLKEVLAG